MKRAKSRSMRSSARTNRWLALYAANGALESLEPWLAEWDQTGSLTPRALEMARFVDDTAYMIPYGFYLRAMFYNRKLLAEAGIDSPPTTLEEFRAAAEAVSKLAGKYGDCCAGAGRSERLDDVRRHSQWRRRLLRRRGQQHADRAGLGRGIEYLAKLYQEKLAPPDSVNWGFNEIVAGFYSGTCAMLDQDPDALIAIEERMPAEDFGVVPFPKGPGWKGLPDDRLRRVGNIRRQRA